MAKEDYYSDLLGDAPDLGLASVAASPSPEAAAASSGGANVSFDGADQIDKLTDWHTALRSADADILPNKRRLDARGRDTLRNDAYVAGGERLHRDKIVGSQFLLNAKPASTILFGKEDYDWETEFQEEVEEKFTLWAESPQKWVDASRMNTLTGLVRLAVGVHLAAGEALLSAEWLTRGFRPFNTCVQMIDTDRLSTPWDRKWDRDIRHGVERDYYGAPIAYHIRTEHERDFLPRVGTLKPQAQHRRIRARKPWGRQQILHVMEQTRPDQTRGFSTMATALTEMRMAKRFKRTELERAIIAATYAASIETELPAGEVYAAMGETNGTNPTVQWATDYLAAVSKYAGGAKNLSINGARIPVFVPGTHLKIQNPGAASPAGSGFEQSLLRHIAAALDISYEELSRDYTNTNYSSARAAMADTGRAMIARKKMVADQVATFVYRLWLEEAINANSLECLKRQNIPPFYEGLNAEAYSACDWIGAGQGTIDPKKEADADVLALNNNFDTLENIIARRHGRDYRKVLRQRAREKASERELRIENTVPAQITDSSQDEEDTDE